MEKPPFKETIFRKSLPSVAEMAKKSEAQGDRVFNFNVTPEEMFTIKQIAQRACDEAKLYGQNIPQMVIAMDVAYIHCNIYPLKLMQLLLADGETFHHDVVTIPARHLDRKNGVILNGIKPIMRQDTN